ncbi:glycine betaine ABC transporter substrate-binding protein [Halomonas janggokensis]|uniref:Glycine betaine ABC transporter substrate-binding protein n=1 Tax=Vreelandella janggokensis TaxID=370767 RepID=A0ABT4IU56_9GAMM|nr:glycine betaine ABC transporter substrate-binding protein [Halomonas janggokensis]MCZ0927209.1 glycine betaine ABC transporter substrate-binding protein [Halomonas janggokensis]MCZ0929717.1 glycine betaine ABC transporter substrate-binding protein [Halomonas janggokensis]
MIKKSMQFSTLALAMGLAVSTAQAQDKGTVHLAYVEWSDAVASTNVVRAVLEQAGFEVDITSLSAAAMWQSVATGDADAMTTAWLPTTHADYYERLKDQVVDLGVSLDGTKLGLVVPSSSEMESIADINEYADGIDGKITGIDPGAGIMSLTEEVIEAYDLDVNLQSGSGATMTAALQDAVNNDEDIVVTGWTPHWKFARWDLKYLEDPENVFGGAEQIHTIARIGLEEDMPEAYAILDAFEWTPEEMGEVQLMNQEEGSDPYENAKKWVEENQDLVQEWLPES